MDNNILNWRNLNVYDSDGDYWGDLGSLVESAPANLDNADIVDRKIESWPGFFIASPDEEPDWDTPRSNVDWEDFEERLNQYRGSDE